MNRSYRPVLVASVLVAAVVGAAVLSVGADETQTGLTTTVFKVGGMTCGGCEASVKMVVKKLDGIEKVTASAKEGRATVTYDPAKVTVDDITTAIEKVGYSAEVVDGSDGGAGARSTAAGATTCLRCG